MEINHGGFDAGMTHEGLDGTDVGSGFEQMGRERMAHGVAGNTFRYICLVNSLFELSL
jgi:hypothetical protein